MHRTAVVCYSFPWVVGLLPRWADLLTKQATTLVRRSAQIICMTQTMDFDKHSTFPMQPILEDEFGPFSDDDAFASRRPSLLDPSSSSDGSGSQWLSDFGVFGGLKSPESNWELVVDNITLKIPASKGSFLGHFVSRIWSTISGRTGKGSSHSSIMWNVSQDSSNHEDSIQGSKTSLKLHSHVTNILPEAPAQEAMQAGDDGNQLTMKDYLSLDDLETNSGGGSSSSSEADMAERDALYSVDDYLRMEKRGDDSDWREVVRGLSFKLRPGKLVAILGASGSGKTSLLDILAGRTPPQYKVQGQLSINGRSIAHRSRALKQAVGYVKQIVHFLPSLTVVETLQFASRLRLSVSMSKEDRRKRVHDVIQMVGLSSCTHRTVGGSENKSLSGGQQRLLAIALQLLHQPGILVLDEPTSGLDASSAEHICSTLHRACVHQSKAVVMSIHQPSLEIARYFDHVLIMSEGSAVYNGPSRMLISYFEWLGYPLPEYSSPYDYYADLATPDSRTDERDEETRERIAQLLAAQQAYAKGLWLLPGELDLVPKIPSLVMQYPITNFRVPSREDVRPRIQRRHSNFTLLSAMSEKSILPGEPDQLNCSGLLKFWILLGRCMKDEVRGYQDFLTRMLQAVILSALLGMVFFQLGTGAADVQNRKALLFISLSLYPFMSVFETIAKVSSQQALIQHDIREGLHTYAQYIAAGTISHVPASVLLCAVFAIPQRLMASQSSAMLAWVAYIMLLLLHLLTSQMMALSTLVFTQSPEYAALIANLIYTGWIMVSGYVININDLSTWIRWMTWTSPLRYAYQGTVITELDGVMFQHSTLNVGGNATATRALRHTTSGSQHLASLTFGSLSLSQCSALLCALWACSLCSVFIAVRVRRTAV